MRFYLIFYNYICKIIMTAFYKIIPIICFCFSAMHGQTQTISPSVISSTGGTISDSATILNWTLGETVIQNIQSGNNYLSQGFHQPYYTIITAVENTTSFFDVKVFPNPSADILNIIINSDTELPYEFFLTDINGKILFQKKVNAGVKQHSFTYNTSNLATALYFLKITNTEKNISETFKIQKMH